MRGRPPRVGGWEHQLTLYSYKYKDIYTTRALTLTLTLPKQQCHKVHQGSAYVLFQQAIKHTGCTVTESSASELKTKLSRDLRTILICAVIWNSCILSSWEHNPTIYISSVWVSVNGRIQVTLYLSTYLEWVSNEFMWFITI
jgi:hypothetical protein